MSHIVWFRNDCRVSDHDALTLACDQGSGPEPVRAVFLWTPVQWQRHDYGPARQFAWSEALLELEQQLATLGIELTVLHADTWRDGVGELIRWAVSVGATDLAFHREFGWDEVKRDRLAVEEAHRAGINCHVFEDRVSRDPAGLLTGQNGMYRVFTPYRKNWLARQQTSPIALPRPVPRAVAPPRPPAGQVPRLDWPGRAELPLTETDAHARLDRFMELMTDYRTDRDFPGEDGTSRLSAALANGAISLRQCLHAALSHPNRDSAGVQTWLSELIWREFYQYLLYWRPELARHEPFYPRWNAFPWSRDDDALAHWQAGTTGVPIVDAGMRQLAQTGWMHNRVRMIVAMYLVKLLQIDWRQGERWFARHLLDIDFASNNGGWQWCASTGVDAAPYFRIFNPYTQSQRFDPRGDYLRCWVPELADLDTRVLHRPSSQDCHKTGYPLPIIDYPTARASTLAAFKAL